MKNITLTLITLVFLASCASQSSNRSQADIEAQTEQLKASPSTWNAPPSEMFSAFGQFEFEPIQLASELQSDQKKQTSASEASKLISDRINLLFSQWQQQNNSSRSLLIESTFTEYKIVSGGARFWAGAFAGDSAVRIDVNIKDKVTGNTLATPFFYQRANALGAAWTFGSHDKSIPQRLAVLVEKYLNDNYTMLEGGPTGRDK